MVGAEPGDGPLSAWSDGAPAVVIRPTVRLGAAMCQDRQLGADPCHLGHRQVGHHDPGLGSVRSASTVPQGSTIMEWPWHAGMPGGSTPTWPPPTTKTWFSTARARSRSSQWAGPVAAVKAAATTSTVAPSRVMIR